MTQTEKCLFLDWKNQQCENAYSTESNLQVQLYSYKTTDFIFSQSQNIKKSQFIWKHKKPKYPKQFQRRKNGPGESNFLTPDFTTKLQSSRGFLGDVSGKEPACQCRRCKRCGFNLWVRKIPWRRARKPTPVFLSGEFHGQRNLVGYSSQ